MKCDNCKIHKDAENSKEPACCIWYMENVVCGDKAVEECDKYEPADTV